MSKDIQRDLRDIRDELKGIKTILERYLNPLIPKEEEKNVLGTSLQGNSTSGSFVKNEEKGEHPVPPEFEEPKTATSPPVLKEEKKVD